VGPSLHRSGGGSNEIAVLRQEVANTKEMVALSLLKEQSASERLRGVDYSVQMPRIEPEVVKALIQAVNQDASVNVRLAAIDALSRAAGQPQVRKSLEQSLVSQESPTVQAALIGYLVDARDRQAVDVLREISKRPDLDITVRNRADRATQQLREFK
jgi:HEAT repeat protein